MWDKLRSAVHLERASAGGSLPMQISSATAKNASHLGGFQNLLHIHNLRKIKQV